MVYVKLKVPPEFQMVVNSSPKNTLCLTSTSVVVDVQPLGSRPASRGLVYLIRCFPWPWEWESLSILQMVESIKTLEERIETRNPGSKWLRMEGTVVLFVTFQTPGIYEVLTLISGANAWCFFGSGDEELASLFLLKYRSAKLWVVCPTPHTKQVESSLLKKIFNKEYFNV